MPVIVTRKGATVTVATDDGQRTRSFVHHGLRVSGRTPTAAVAQVVWVGSSRRLSQPFGFK